MKTSKAEVYPRKEYESMDFDSVDCPDDVDPIDLYQWKQTSPTVTRKPLNLV